MGADLGFQLFKCDSGLSLGEPDHNLFQLCVKVVVVEGRCWQIGELVKQFLFFFLAE